MLSFSRENPDQFVIEFISFYKEFVGSASKYLRSLAEIQKKYPKLYETFKDFEMEPTNIMKLYDKMDANIRSRFLNVLFNTMALSQKVNTNIFILTSKEQLKLAEEIEQFMKMTENIINEIKELKTEKKD